jgi:hypothetical protein
MAKNSRVAVYAVDTGTDPFSGGLLTRYYACRRPNGQSVAIGQSAESGGEYPPNVEMEDLRLAGTFVADESAAGFASAAACAMSEPPPACNGIVKYWVKIADVRARRTVKVFLSGPVRALALSPTGATAWVIETTASSSTSSPTSTLYATAVHPAGHGSLSARPKVIDSGQAITSVSFTGSSLHWSNGGQPKRQTIS